MGVQSQLVSCTDLKPLPHNDREETSKVIRSIQFVAFVLFLSIAQAARAQVQVGDDLRMNLSGMLTGGYQASYGDQLPSNHGIDYGGNATLSGSYYNPNFLSFTVAPYYDQSKANSNFQSLTESSGVNATANFFTGSKFPGFVSYNYSRNSTGTFGLVGTPNFATVGTGQGFGVGWSALLPDWPTFSVSYSQGSGTGNVFGTNEESNSSTKILNVRSSYALAGWRLSALYTHININSDIPSFLSGEQGNNFSNSSGNNFGINGSHNLPWHGSIALTFNHSTYSGDYGTTVVDTRGNNDYTTNTQTANAIFHPTLKLSLFANETYTDNLNGYIYQNIANNSGGVPLVQLNTNSNSTTLSTGANYTFTKNLYGQAQITYFDQTYFGQSYQGSYASGTVGYGKRILNTFTVSGTVIESSNKFANNSLGFVGNLNGFRHIGLWEVSGAFSYAQNVQTILVTYATSYYNYSARLGRRLGRGMQWTVAYNGNHSGFTQQPGELSKSSGFSTSLALRRLDLTANYIKASGQSILTSTGIQPLAPTPGLPPAGIIVYNGQSYGGGITITPIPRLYISGNYSHATSDTLSTMTFSNNRTDIFYGQLQYRLRKVSVLAGYTKFSQAISAAGTPPGSQYSYFVGVTRWFNFF
jgi:hypothetical protein